MEGYWAQEKFYLLDAPTARSGGILASLRTACRSRSYTRSTSVYPLGMPYREQYWTDLASLVLDMPFRFSVSHAIVFFPLTTEVENL